MENLTTFSFRYGRNDGYFVWYRLTQLDTEQAEVQLDTFITERKQDTFCIPISKSDILWEKLQTYHISEWDGFCQMEQCLCAGDGWALHIRTTSGKEIHAMGHSAYPKHFQEVKELLQDIFAYIFPKYKVV